MCDQNNLKDQSATNLKFEELRCDQNNLKEQSITILKLKRSLMLVPWWQDSNFFQESSKIILSPTLSNIILISPISNF